mgnify:CR=1 FL=1
MKSLKYIIVLGIVTGVTFSSCEDWLDENPKYSVDNTVIFDSEETAKQALDACYGYLTTVSDRVFMKCQWGHRGSRGRRQMVRNRTVTLR